MDERKEVFGSWEELFVVHKDELLYYKALYDFLCKQAQARFGRDGLAELTERVRQFFEDISQGFDHDIKLKYALAHILARSTISSITRCHVDGCELDLEGDRSIRLFFARLIEEYSLYQTVFIKYD